MASSKERMKESRTVTSWLLHMSMPSELYRQNPIEFDARDLQRSGSRMRLRPYTVRVAKDHAVDLHVGAVLQVDGAAALAALANSLVSMMPRPRIRTPDTPRPPIAV